MLLAIDVGNTETKLGCFDGSDALAHSWRITTDAKRTADECGVIFVHLFETAGVAVRDIDRIVVASVVPRLDAAIQEACTRYFGCAPVFFKPTQQTLMKVVTERPGEVGADLVAAAIGGRHVYGAPLIVISYGTATVFMAVGETNEYLGVAIAPGINISIDALVGRTAKLPQIALDAPKHAIGRDTISALQSGIIYGFAGQTEAIVARFRDEMGVAATVVATGGLAGVIAPHTPSVRHVNPNLSLIGLACFAKYIDS